MNVFHFFPHWGKEKKINPHLHLPFFITSFFEDSGSTLKSSWERADTYARTAAAPSPGSPPAPLRRRGAPGPPIAWSCQRRTPSALRARTHRLPPPNQPRSDPGAEHTTHVAGAHN